MVESDARGSASDGLESAAIGEIERRGLALPNQGKPASVITDADVSGLAALGNSPACNDWLYRLCMKLMDERAALLKENEEWRQKCSTLTVEIMMSALRTVNDSAFSPVQNLRVGF